MTWLQAVDFGAEACAGFLAISAVFAAFAGLMLGGSLLVTWIADRLTGGGPGA